MAIPEIEFNGLYQRFVNRFDYRNISRPILNEIIKVPHIHPITNQILIKEIIARNNGLVRENKPYSLSTFVPDTQFLNVTIASIVTRYLLKWKLPTELGMSIKELLDLPSYELWNYIDAFKAFAKEESENMENVLNKQKIK